MNLVLVEFRAATSCIAHQNRTAEPLLLFVIHFQPVSEGDLSHQFFSLLICNPFTYFIVTEDAAHKFKQNSCCDNFCKIHRPTACNIVKKDSFTDPLL